MKVKTRTISKLAREVGVSVETIRYYERRGLIEQPQKIPGRYREYSDETLAQIQYIKLAKAFGFSLSEIESLTEQLKEKVTFCKAVEDTSPKAAETEPPKPPFVSGFLEMTLIAPPIELRPNNVPCGPRRASTRSTSTRSRTLPIERPK